MQSPKLTALNNICSQCMSDVYLIWFIFFIFSLDWLRARAGRFVPRLVGQWGRANFSYLSQLWLYEPPSTRRGSSSQLSTTSLHCQLAPFYPAETMVDSSHKLQSQCFSKSTSSSPLTFSALLASPHCLCHHTTMAAVNSTTRRYYANSYFWNSKRHRRLWAVGGEPLSQASIWILDQLYSRNRTNFYTFSSVSFPMEEIYLCIKVSTSLKHLMIFF